MRMRIRLSHRLYWRFLSIVDKWQEAQNRESRSSYQKRGCLMGSCLLMHGAPPLSAPLSSFPLLLLTLSTPVTFSPAHWRLHLLTLSAPVTQPQPPLNSLHCLVRFPMISGNQEVGEHCSTSKQQQSRSRPKCNRGHGCAGSANVIGCIVVAEMQKAIWKA